MEKNTRVRIVRGRKGKGQTGTIFWTGPDKFGEGERCGVRGDDGETYWVSLEYVEALDESDPDYSPAAVEPKFEKGDAVRWKVDGEEGTGEVFWIGQSKSGALRVGIRDDETEEAVWAFANQVQLVDDDEDHDGPKASKKKKAKKKAKKKKAKAAKKARKKVAIDAPDEDLASFTVGQLASQAVDRPYSVFLECERRLDDEGRSPELARAVKAASAGIEDLLLGGDDRDEIIDACMTFAEIFKIEIYIDDEPEEGVNQAMDHLAERLGKF